MNNIIFKTILLKGEMGRGIVSIEKTGTLGRIDTYTICYTDGTTSTFEVTNGGSSGGAVDTVNGMTGNVVLTYSNVNALPDTTKLKDLEGDTTHRTVTDAEKSKWSGKVTSVNGYTGVIALTYSDVGALPSTTTLADLPTDATHRTVSDTEKNAWNAKTTTNYTPTITDGVELGVIAENGVNKSIKAPNYSNPNLLDNPWFTVNQKGFTSGSAAQNSTPIDRWQVRFNATVLALTPNGLNITNSTDNHGIAQLLDIPTDYTTTFTFSMLLSDGTIYTKTGTFQTDTSGQTQVISSPFSVYMGLWTINGKLAPAIYLSGNSSTESFTITALKLEVGTVSTLALDSAPNYATELMKCQRYYRKLNLSNCIGMTTQYQTVSDTHYVNSIWDLPMRAIPTISYTTGAVTGVLSVVGATTRTIITKSIVDISSDINGNLTITTDTSDTTNVFTPLNPVFVNATGIEFNAEL